MDLLVWYVLVFVVSGVVCLGTVPRARTVQHRGTREGLVVFLISVAVWSWGYVGYLLAPTARLRVTFYILGFVFAFVAVGSWVYFCAAYTGRSPRQMPYRNAVLGVFAVFVVLKITNPLHGLYFTTEWTTEPFPHLAVHHNLLYWVLLGLSYAAISVGFFMLFERFYHTGTDSRPLVLLAGVTAVPAVFTILSGELGGLLPLMYEPPGVAVFAVGTLFVYFERFEAVRLTAGTDDPAVFVDPSGCLREYNRAAEEIFPSLSGSIGKPLESSVPSVAEALSGSESGVGSEVVEVSRGFNGDGEEATKRFYEVSAAPFVSGEVVTGKIITARDVTDRETYRRRLEEKTEQLEALNRVVRHDIRNDMTVVLGWAETLEDHVDDEGRDALEHVLEKSRHVVGITRVARDFIESLGEGESTDLKRVDLRHHLKAEMDAVRESYPDAEFEVSGEIPDVSVEANEMVSSVFRNILGNAIQHSDEETPEVIVSCENRPETVLIRFADNGPGIPDEKKDEIFGKGEKGLESGGSGIGLYLVNLLVESYGGEVWIEENDPKGTVFNVELSKSDSDPQKTY
ncbi:ATP-binding protein [Halorutilales archaeon Cl-col2-1]